MSKNNLQQQAQMKPGRANKQAACLNALEKTGDHLNYQNLVDCWRIRNGLKPMYFKEILND